MRPTDSAGISFPQKPPFSGRHAADRPPSKALEIAIAALEGLCQEEKTIGVISHVELLKDRIGTQVIVEKQPGGVSRVRVWPEVEAA